MQVDVMHVSHSESTIGSAILVALRDGSLAPKELKGRVQKSFKKLSVAAWNAALEELVSRRRIYRRHKLGKTGKPLKAVESFSVDPPPPPPPSPEQLARDEIVRVLQREAPSAALLKTRVRAAVRGLTAKAYDEVLKDLIVSLLSSVKSPTAATASLSDRETVLRSLRELVEREGRGSLIVMRKLRAAVSLAKDRFDAVLLALYAENEVILHHHDHVASLSAAERESLVVDNYGNHYVGVALRGGS
jgi:hypothetical protein